MKTEPMPALFKCQLCGEGVEPEDKSVWRRVSGWSDAKRGAKQGSVVFPVEMNQYAHAACVRLLKLGVSAGGQDSFF